MGRLVWSVGFHPTQAGAEPAWNTSKDFMKRCSKCNISKDTENFCKCNKSKDGLQSQCKACKVSSVKKAPSRSKTYKKSEKSKLKRREYSRQYHHKNKIGRNISRRMRQSLNGERKSSSWVNLVNFTLDELKNHLELKFVYGMTWENYGKVWHIDHIKPLSSFNITSDDCQEFRDCWSLSNLQPLFALDNILKSNK